MLVLERILAIPDQSIDYLQMGISGGERAALAARGFVRKDGTKAKDYMIRTIQKTEKNKAKAEKAIIKGDLKLSMKDDLGKAVKDAEDAYAANPTPDNYRKLDEKTKAYEMGYMLFGTSERWTNAEKNAALIAEKQSKAKPQNTPIAPDTAKKLAITDKKGFQSEGAAAKKIKGAIAGVKGGKVVKGVSPRDRGIGKGFYVRDTLVSPDKFNALPKKQQQEILALKKEFESSGYIDARTAIGPDQSRRMSDRQRNKIADTASRVFAIEDKVKQALKPPSQKSAEAKQKEVKDLQAQIDFVNNEIRVQETFNAAKINSKRNNLTKQGYQDMLKRRAELQSKLQKMGK